MCLIKDVIMRTIVLSFLKEIIITNEENYDFYLPKDFESSFLNVNGPGHGTSFVVKSEGHNEYLCNL